ncbi:MAG: tRNA uridine(34) 5-carboxymethylaminomethyl modification radical SAM/GNAT enzyme Elp3 [Candidatus Nealsonbacteria bacterium]
MNQLEAIIKELIKSRAKTQADLARAKRKASEKYGLPFPNNIILLKTYHELVKNKRVKPQEKVRSLLRTRPVRSLSGIVNVSVLTKPYKCPGKCLFCPIQKGAPKSYLSNEPAVMRAILNRYDPYKQTKMRLQALADAGHPTDKVELRIIGGTFSYYPEKYKTWFVKRCFDACNKKNSSTITKAQIINEKAKHRIIGLSIETRPDFINPKEIKRLRRLGATSVELGVQSIYDDVLKLNRRGHAIRETIKATQLLKDAGFKILYQMMPNLPGSTPKRDEHMFRELFSNQAFQPDWLKIYPCALLKEAPLYEFWQKKKYRPYTNSQLVNLVKSIKKKIPYYVRIQRITRDIPQQSIVSGPAKISNLRQILATQSKTEGWLCSCIRCREVKEDYNAKEKLYLFRQEYEASNGKEIFLSFENKKRTKLYSLLRLRLTSQNKAFIREIHTYGQQLSFGQNSLNNLSPQHKGLGKKMMKEAERIVKKKFKLNELIVISGVGVRGYYKKIGYHLFDAYMVKRI